MKEEWKDIEGAKGLYRISNKGRVMRLPRYAEAGRGGGQRYLKTKIWEGHDFATDKDGSPVFHILIKKLHVKMGPIRISTLVAKHFIGAPPSRAERYVKIIDGDVWNNCVSNLKYTHLGKCILGCTHTEITTGVLERAKYLRQRKWSYKRISKEVGCSETGISYRLKQEGL